MKYLLLILLFCSCASMRANYKFCKNTDWRTLGIADGKNDENLEEKVQQYKLMCRNFDDEELRPDITMYQFGHSVGVKQLCTPNMGFDRGSKGFNTSLNCKKNKHRKFFSEMKKGVKVYCSKGTGYNLAMEGKALSKVCNEREHPKFYEGVAKGIKTYCTYQYGLREGGLDREYTGVCSGRAEDEFLKGHTKGKTQSEIKKLKKQIEGLNKQLTREKQRSRTQQSEIARLRREVRRLTNELESLSRRK